MTLSNSAWQSDGRPRSLRSLMRPPMNASIVGRIRMRVYRQGLILLMLVTPGCQASSTGVVSDASAATDSEDDSFDRPESDPRTTCSSSADCVLVHWGCCETACGDGVAFTVAVNKAAEPTVPRVLEAGPCGQVCSISKTCGFTLSTSCDNGSCLLHCSGQCPPAN